MDKGGEKQFAGNYSPATGRSVIFEVSVGDGITNCILLRSYSSLMLNNSCFLSFGRRMEQKI